MMRILYVEDNHEMFSLVERVATAGNHWVMNVTTAEDAAVYVPNLEPDLLLIDIQLAGEANGVELVALLRENGCDLPMVMITSNDSSQMRDRCFAAGCDAYYVKPVGIPQLREIMERYDPDRAA